MPKIYKDAVGKEYSYDDLVKTIGTIEGADSFIKRKGMKLKQPVDVFNKTKKVVQETEKPKPIIEVPKPKSIVEKQKPIVEKQKPIVSTKPVSVFDKTTKKPSLFETNNKTIDLSDPLKINAVFSPKPKEKVVIPKKYNVDYSDLIDKPTELVKNTLQQRIGDDYEVTVVENNIMNPGVTKRQNTAKIRSKKTGEVTSFILPNTSTANTLVGPVKTIENQQTQTEKSKINDFLNRNSLDSKLYKTTGIPKSMVSKIYVKKYDEGDLTDDDMADELMNTRIPALRGYFAKNLPNIVDESIGVTQSYNRALKDPEALQKIKDYLYDEKKLVKVYGVDKSYTDKVLSKYLQKLAKEEQQKLNDETGMYMATLPNAPVYFREQFAKEQTDPKLKTLAQKGNSIESIKTNLYELEQQVLSGKKVDPVSQAKMKQNLFAQEKEFEKLQKEAFGKDTKFYMNNMNFSHVAPSNVTSKNSDNVSDISTEVHTALALYAGTPREGLQRAWIDINKKWYGVKKHGEEKINVVIKGGPKAVPGITYGGESSLDLFEIKRVALANGAEVAYNKKGEMIIKNIPRKVIDRETASKKDLTVFSFKGNEKPQNIEEDLNAWKQYSKGVVADRTALGYLNVFNVKPESIDLGFKQSGINFVKTLGNELIKSVLPADYRTGEANEGFKIQTNRTIADNVSNVAAINNLKLDDRDKKHLEKNLGEVISQTTTGIIPVVAKLAAVEAATEGAGTIGAFTNAGKSIKALWNTYKAGNAWQKGVYHTTKIVWEEAKMQGVLDAKAGSGAGFYIGGNLTRFRLSNLPPRWRMINNVVNTGLSSGIGGVAGGKVGGMLEGAISDITGKQEYKDFIEEHYGTLGGDTKQNIADAIVFGALGISHLKANDLKSIGKIKASINEVQGKIDKLDSENGELNASLTYFNPDSPEYKQMDERIKKIKSERSDLVSVLEPMKQIQWNEDLRYTLARDNDKLAAYLSSVSSNALGFINKQENNKTNPVKFKVESLGSEENSRYNETDKTIIINKDRLYSIDPFDGTKTYLELGQIPHEVFHAMGQSMFPKVPVLDAEGNPAKDKNGEPLMREDYEKWNSFADMVLGSAENPLHRPLTQEDDVTWDQAIENAYSDTDKNKRNIPEEKIAWTIQRLQDQNVDTYSLMKDVKQDIVSWWERKTGRGPKINNGKDLLDFLDRMNRSVLNSKNAEKQYEKFRDIDISDFTVNKEILSKIDKQIIAEKGGAPIDKKAIDIVKEYVRKNNPRGLDTNVSQDLIDDIRAKVEDYWGVVPDRQVSLMYQNLDHAEDLIETRGLEKNPITQIANKGLNLALVKNVEQRLNNFIELAERNNITPEPPSIKESKDLESLTKEKEALKAANIAMARKEGGMTDADREAAKENYNKILEINKQIERVGLPPTSDKVSDANVKISNRNKELMSIIKDPESKAGSIQKATDQLLENNMGAIQKLVKSKFDTLREEGAMTKEDLLQNVKIDFLNLVRTFDPSKNDNFGAYMTPLLKRRIAAHFAEASIIKTKVNKAGMEKELKALLTPDQLRKVRDIEEDAKDYGLSKEEVNAEIKELLTDEQLEQWNEIEDKYQEKVYTDSLSGEYAPDLMDTAEEHDFEIVDRDIYEEKIQLHKDLELDSNIMKAIDDGIIKTMKEDLPPIDGKGFKIALKNSLAEKIHSTLMARVGKGMEYRKYLSNHWKTMFDAIPVSVMTQSFRPWVDHVLDANGKKAREKTQVGLFIYEKRKVNKEEFMDYFMGEITPNSPSVLSKRKKSLLAAVGNEIAYNSMIDMFANNREFRAMYESKQELLNNELADNYIAQLALRLDRETPDVKYSKDITPKLIQDLGKVFKENKELDPKGILDKAIDKFNLVGLPEKAKKELLGIVETASEKLTTANNSAIVTKDKAAITSNTIAVNKTLKQNESANWLAALSNVDNIKGNSVKTVVKSVNTIANNIATGLGITPAAYRGRLSIQTVDTPIKKEVRRTINNQELGFSEKEVEVLFQDKPIQEHVPSKKFLTNFDDNIFKNKNWYSKLLQLSDVQDGFGAGKSGRPQLHTLRSAEEVRAEIESRIEEIEDNLLNGEEYFLNNISDTTINSQIAFHKRNRDGRQYRQWTQIRDDADFKNEYIAAIQDMQIEALTTNVFDELYNQNLPIEFRYLAINEMIKHDYTFTPEGNIVRTSSKKSDLQKSLSIFKRVNGNVLAKTYAENSNSGRSLGEEYVKNLREDMIANAVINNMSERKRHEIPEGIWYEFKQSSEEKDINDLYALSATTQITQGAWCTGSDLSTAASHIGNGDFWILTDKNTKQAIFAVRYEDGAIWEMRGIGKGQAIRDSESKVLDHVVSEFEGGKSFEGIMKWRRNINDFILDPESYKKLGFEEATELLGNEGDTNDIGDPEDSMMDVEYNFRGKLTSLFSDKVWLADKGYTPEDIYISDPDGEGGKFGQDDIFKAKISIGDIDMPFIATNGGAMELPNLEKHLNGRLLFENINNDIYLPNLIKTNNLHLKYTDNSKLGKIYLNKEVNSGGVRIIGDLAEFGAVDSFKPIEGNINAAFFDVRFDNAAFKSIDLSSVNSKRVTLDGLVSKNIMLNENAKDIDINFWKLDTSSDKRILEVANKGFTIIAGEKIDSMSIMANVDIPMDMPSTKTIGNLRYFGDNYYNAIDAKLADKAKDVLDSRTQDETLYQDQRGAIIKSNTKSLILLSKTNADVTTVFHELAHEWERVLEKHEVKTIEEWSGHKQGTTEYAEAFARGAEKYIYEGSTGNTKPDSIFKKLTILFKKAVSNAVEYFKGVNELSPPMKDIYSRMLANEVIRKGVTESTFINQKGFTEPQIKEAKRIVVNKEFNEILEEKTGISATKIINRPDAYDFARSKGKWKFFIPPNTEDFAGMIYNFIPTGKKGNKAQEFFDRHLFRPYAEGMDFYEKDKIRLLKLYKGAKERFDITPDLLKSKVGSSKFTHDQAIRFYLWNKQKGVTIEGISDRDLTNLVSTVNNDYKLKAFAEYLDTMLGRKKGYVKFDKNWHAGTIASDVIEYIETKIREEHLKPWKENVNIIFDDNNKNKILATQGENFLRNLNSRLSHMETGKVQGKSNPLTDWLLGSTANIMFLNTRSAILQMSAAGNYVDWKNNNPIAIAKSFANQKQFWSDFNMLWNSPFLSDRRGGMKFDLVAEDVATMGDSESGFKSLMARAKTFGFKPTVLGDSIAIAFGGASYYRNTYNALIKEGYSPGEASKKAMIEWQEKSEDTQQSNRPDKISNIQTSPWGKIIFSFSNTSMQYNRIIKKSFLDLSQGRGDAKEHVSKILYYGVINNALFNILQSALFNVFLGGDDDDDQVTKKKEFDEDPKLAMALDGMLDTLLKGAGGYGAVLAVLKNMSVKAYEQSINGRLDSTKIAQTALSVSPSMSRKMQQLNRIWEIYTNKQLREQATTKGVSFENPGIAAAAGGVSMVANIPADRIFQKLNNLKDMLDANNTTASRIENFLGYSRVNQGYDDSEAPDPLTPKQRLEYQEYQEAFPGFTIENYKEQKSLPPEAEKKNKKTWLYLFREIKVPKDPLTSVQRAEFNEYAKEFPGFTLDNYAEQKSIVLDKEKLVDWKEYETKVKQKIIDDSLKGKKPKLKSVLNK